MSELATDLAQLHSRVVEMGSLTQSMVIRALDGVARADIDAFGPVFDAEERMDQLQLDIDEEVIRVIAEHSPVAGDLRFVFSVSRIAAELERIGDQAMNLCENVGLMTTKSDSPPITEVVGMGENVKEMLSGALKAFGNSDTKQAMATIAQDDMVDAMNDQIVKRLLQDDSVQKTIVDSKDAAHLLSQILIASSLERIADQATNICEDIVYMVKGSDIRHA